MSTKLIKQGDQYFLPLDKEIIERIGIDADTSFEITADTGRLVAAVANGTARRKQIAESLKKINTQYGEALQRLAE